MVLGSSGTAPLAVTQPVTVIHACSTTLLVAWDIHFSRGDVHFQVIAGGKSEPERSDGARGRGFGTPVRQRRRNKKNVLPPTKIFFL